MRKLTAMLAGMSLLLLATSGGAAECRYSAPRKAWVNAAGLRSLRFDLGSSDMHIRGVPGLNGVEVRATACASSKEWLKDLRVSATRQGDSAVIDAESHDVHFSLFGSSYAYLKLDVRVPAAVAVVVGTGSGDVDAAGLASLDFESGSGDLLASDIAGALTLQLGSADARLQHVGSVDLRGTGSGDVTADDVRGDVHADHSGSGDLRFRDVRGSVRIGSTGSGDIALAGVGRDIDVGSTGSGDVTVDGAGGNLHVGSTGSGDVRYHGVKGTVSVPKDDD
jgi:DUF4097 and DUF4098 domain-containing protein YvlB